MTDQATEAVPAPLTTAESTELDSLRAEMADTRGRDFDGHHSQQYWSNPEKQARALELIDREAGGVLGSPAATAEPAGRGDVAAPADRAPAADEEGALAVTESTIAAALGSLRVMGDVGEAWADELESGGARNTLEVMEDVRQAILADMGDDAGEIETAFSGLDDNVQAAFYREMGSPYLPRQPEASSADLEQFEETVAGKILSAEWGSDAPKRLGVVLYRWNRLTADLTDEQFAEADAFFSQRLRPAERALILDRLSA